MQELQSTAYKINKSKFFGQEPEAHLALKQDSLEFFTGLGSPAKIPNKEALANSGLRNRRSTVANTGSTIVRSSSQSGLSGVSENVFNPVTGEYVARERQSENRSLLTNR